MRRPVDWVRAHRHMLGPAAAVLAFAGLFAAPYVYRLVDPPLLTFVDGGGEVEVWAEDGCLQARYGGAGERAERISRYCAWARADGTDLWVPRVKERRSPSTT